METIGQINDRIILYSNVRLHSDWYKKLPSTNWVVFTITDKEDEELINDTTIRCLDRGVLYTCSAGELGSLTEEYFDEEIVLRELDIESHTGVQSDYDKTPMTTSHKNFSEGFWFSTTVANPTINDMYLKVDKVICVDMTKRGVKQYLKHLIELINTGWLPNEKEVEVPIYDR